MWGLVHAKGYAKALTNTISTSKIVYRATFAIEHSAHIPDIVHLIGAQIKNGGRKEGKGKTTLNPKIISPSITRAYRHKNSPRDTNESPLRSRRLSWSSQHLLPFVADWASYLHCHSTHEHHPSCSPVSTCRKSPRIWDRRNHCRKGTESIGSISMTWNILREIQYHRMISFDSNARESVQVIWFCPSYQRTSWGQFVASSPIEFWQIVSPQLWYSEPWQRERCPFFVLHCIQVFLQVQLAHTNHCGRSNQEDKPDNSPRGQAHSVR